MTPFESEHRPPTWVRVVLRIFRVITVIGRLGPIVLLLIGIASLQWIWIVTALVMLPISVTIAWAVNQGRPTEERRRIWWP